MAFWVSSVLFRVSPPLAVFTHTSPCISAETFLSQLYCHLFSCPRVSVVRECKGLHKKDGTAGLLTNIFSHYTRCQSSADKLCLYWAGRGMTAMGISWHWGLPTALRQHKAILLSTHETNTVCQTHSTFFHIFYEKKGPKKLCSIWNTRIGFKRFSLAWFNCCWIATPSSDWLLSREESNKI